MNITDVTGSLLKDETIRTDPSNSELRSGNLKSVNHVVVQLSNNRRARNETTTSNDEISVDESCRFAALKAPSLMPLAPSNVSSSSCTTKNTKFKDMDSFSSDSQYFEEPGICKPRSLKSDNMSSKWPPNDYKISDYGKRDTPATNGLNESGKLTEPNPGSYRGTYRTRISRRAFVEKQEQKLLEQKAYEAQNSQHENDDACSDESEWEVKRSCSFDGKLESESPHRNSDFTKQLQLSKKKPQYQPKNYCCDWGQETVHDEDEEYRLQLEQALLLSTLEEEDDVSNNILRWCDSDSKDIELSRTINKNDNDLELAVELQCKLLTEEQERISQLEKDDEQLAWQLHCEQQGQDQQQPSQQQQQQNQQQQQQNQQQNQHQTNQETSQRELEEHHVEDVVQERQLLRDVCSDSMIPIVSARMMDDDIDETEAPMLNSYGSPRRNSLSHPLVATGTTKSRRRSSFSRIFLPWNNRPENRSDLENNSIRQPSSSTSLQEENRSLEFLAGSATEESATHAVLIGYVDNDNMANHNTRMLNRTRRNFGWSSIGIFSSAKNSRNASNR